jgi:hypothetical protein
LLSFLDESIDLVLRGHNHEISKENVQVLEMFVKFNIMLEKHLNHRENTIFTIIETFKNYIYRKRNNHHSTRNISTEKSELTTTQQTQPHTAATTKLMELETRKMVLNVEL